MRDRYKIVLASWAPFLAGAEVAAERLALGLVEAGHEVVVVLGTDGAALERMRSVGLTCRYVPVRFTDKLKWLSYRSARNAWVKVLREVQPDIVHSNDLPTHQIVSDAARRLGIPRVCHHRWIFEGPAINWFNKYGAERHLFVSRYLMDELSGASATLAAAGGYVVYDGLPLRPLPTEAQKAAARSELGLPQSRTVILFAGQIIERKGVADLLRAWALLAPRWQDQAVLIIVGDDLEQHGSYRRRMESLATELGCPASFVGFQKNVVDWMTASDIALMPSHKEPLGLVALEAMAVGIPAIACAVDGIRETVIHEETGLLTAPHAPRELATAIERLLADAVWRRELGAAGRKRCSEKFSLRSHVDEVVRHYGTLLRPLALRTVAAVAT
jgi:glycosyltransferase involved in cell wall biosynthesis